MQKKYLNVRLHLLIVISAALIIIGYLASSRLITFSANTFAFTNTSTVFFNLVSNADFANQDGKSVQLGSRTGWIGTGQYAGSSYLALRFKGTQLPAGSQVVSAKLTLTSNQDQWINTSFSVFAENDTNSSLSFNELFPSNRGTTIAAQTYAENSKWIKDKAYSYDVTTPVKEVISQLRSSDTVVLVIKGNGGSWGRKFIYGKNSTGKSPMLQISYSTEIAEITSTPTPTTEIIPTNTPTLIPTAIIPSTTLPSTTVTPVSVTPTSGHEMGSGDESMAMMAWQAGAKNGPNPVYDKCDDGTDIVQVHKKYYVIAYDGMKYPTWHPPVVNNPITGVGKCYFGHEHGTDPQKYLFWNEIVQHFGKDINGDGVISPMVINVTTGAITPGDHAGIPFGIANEHMDQYYNQEGRDSIFVRHEDHVGHKIEFVNKEADVNTNIDGHNTASTHQMAQLSGTNGLNVPYYSTSGSNEYKPTGVVCTHLHKFHQGTHSGDAIRNNLHEVIFHSACMSVDVNGINAPAYYPNNTVILTGMMAFGKPGEYVRFCFADRTTKVCPDGKGSNGSCIVNDPLISKLPNAINSNSLGRNMVDRYCLENWSTLNPGNNYFGPYEIWEGDLRIQKADGDMLAEHGRQWDVLDPIRFVDPNSPTGFSYNSEQCAPGGAFDGIQFIGGCNSRSSNTPWNSPQSGFKGLKRTTYFGRNRVSNPGGSQIWWTDPLGGNAVTTAFSSGLKQRISPVEADIQKVQSRIQQLYGTNNFLNDRAIQRLFNDGNDTVHAPN